MKRKRPLKIKVGRLNADWREDYDYRTQLQKFDCNIKSLVQILEIAHSAGRMAERAVSHSELRNQIKIVRTFQCVKADLKCDYN